jgi:hypothetical protein
MERDAAMRPMPGDDAGRDAGLAPRDGGPGPRDDAGRPSDAGGADAARPDAGAPQAGVADAGADAGCGPGGCFPFDVCADALDISTGGLYTLETCGAAESATSMCGTAGTADVIVRGDAPSSGSTYRLQVPAGWMILQVDAACGAMPFSCGAESWAVSGATPGGRWYFALERADGSCGTVDLSVERLM